LKTHYSGRRKEVKDDRNIDMEKGRKERKWKRQRVGCRTENSKRK